MTRPRWFTEFGEDHSRGYVRRFRRLAADGADIAGEARTIDALLARGSRVLDAGCGPGRVGAELFARGHDVVGVDADPILIDAARADHPGPSWIVGDLVDLDGLHAPGEQRAGGLFDLVVLAGNVMVFLAPGTEARVLRQVSQQVRVDGLVVCGFATDREYRLAAFDRDCAAAGLLLELRFATWDLRPWREDADWAVSVLRRIG